MDCALSAGSSVSLQGALKPIPSFPTHQARGHIPGEDWQIDLTHMPPTRKIKHMLALVDTFSGWIEASPMRLATASEVAQFLIGEIIPRFGLPLYLQSNNGSAFISQITQQVAQSLGITWKFHIPIPGKSRKGKFYFQNTPNPTLSRTTKAMDRTPSHDFGSH